MQKSEEERPLSKVWTLRTNQNLIWNHNYIIVMIWETWGKHLSLVWLHMSQCVTSNDWHSAEIYNAAKWTFMRRKLYKSWKYFTTCKQSFALCREIQAQSSVIILILKNMVHIVHVVHILQSTAQFPIPFPLYSLCTAGWQFHRYRVSQFFSEYSPQWNPGSIIRIRLFRKSCFDIIQQPEVLVKPITISDCIYL